MWNLSSPTRDGLTSPAFEVWSLNHSTASEVPTYVLKPSIPLPTPTKTTTKQKT